MRIEATDPRGARIRTLLNVTVTIRNAPTRGGGGGGDAAAGVEISGPAFAAPDTESVFTVTDTTGLQTLSWTATGPKNFTASGN